MEVAEIKATGIGKNVTIICHSHSVSSLRSVTWFKDNIIINETSSHMNFGEKLGDKAFMYIYLTQEDDGGNYTCQVQNEAGRTGLSYSSELKVLKGIYAWIDIFIFLRIDMHIFALIYKWRFFLMSWIRKMVY